MYFLQSTATLPLDGTVVEPTVVVLVVVVGVVEEAGVDVRVVLVEADVLVTGGLVVVGEALVVVAPPEVETLISVHPENQKPAKSHSQNTVYFPAAKFAGTVT